MRTEKLSESDSDSAEGRVTWQRVPRSINLSIDISFNEVNTIFTFFVRFSFLKEPQLTGYDLTSIVVAF